MASTLRKQNKCKDCQYTWYPRGKNLSRVCPNCGGADVAIVTSWTPIIAIAGIGLYLVFGGKSSDSTSASAPGTPQEPLASPATDVVEHATAPAAPVRPAATKLEPREEVIESARQTARPVEPDRVATEPAVAPPKPSVTAASPPPPVPYPAKVDEYERIFSDEEITALEEQKQYTGNDPIVRARLGIPSRDTKKLFR